MADMIDQCAADALQALLDAGFDEATVRAEAVLEDELNIAHNDASLLRSTERHSLAMTGIWQGRKASTQMSDLSDANLRLQARHLRADVESAPVDTANAVTGQQRGSFVRGPLSSDPELIASTAAELIAFRARDAAAFTLEEGTVSHTCVRSRVLSSRDTDLDETLGWYGLSVLGTARDGNASSSMNYTGGNTHDLLTVPAEQHFGIDAMMRDTIAQTHPRALAAKFTGQVILTPHAVSDLLHWLLGQLSDVQLISGSSLYRERVHDQIASPMLGLRSRFDGPGVSGLSADGYVAAPVEVVTAGVLQCLLPSLYGSRKTGLVHVPTGHGWEIVAGTSRLQDMIRSVDHGALVGRLSMGSPAANGDFSGVIKNSFLLDGGQRTHALAEVMISGNMATMLNNLFAVSVEREDNGSSVLPWMQIPGVYFS